MSAIWKATTTMTTTTIIYNNNLHNERWQLQHYCHNVNQDRQRRPLQLFLCPLVTIVCHFKNVVSFWTSSPLPSGSLFAVVRIEFRKCNSECQCIASPSLLSWSLLLLRRLKLRVHAHVCHRAPPQGSIQFTIITRHTYKSLQFPSCAPASLFFCFCVLEVIFQCSKNAVMTSFCFIEIMLIVCLYRRAISRKYVVMCRKLKWNVMKPVYILWWYNFAGGMASLNLLNGKQSKNFANVLTLKFIKLLLTSFFKLVLLLTCIVFRK